MIYLIYFAYIWLIFMVNVGKYTIHGWYGIYEAAKTVPTWRIIPVSN